MLSNLDKKINLLNELSKYHYIVDFSNKPFKSVLLNNLTCNDFFYFYDKGEPLYSIAPRNITLKVDYLFRNDIEPKLSDKLLNGILYQDYDLNTCMTCFNAYKSDILKLVVDIIKNDTLIITTKEGSEQVDLRQLIYNISIKIVKK